MKKIKAILIFLALFLPSFVLAAPSVNSVIGVVGKNQTITLTGNSFGPTGPTIYKWDDFEGGTHVVGQSVGDGPGSTAWSTDCIDGIPGGNFAPTVSSSGGRIGSSKHLQAYAPAEWYSGGAGIRFIYPVQPPTTVYVSWWWNWHGSVNTASNIKPFQPISSEHSSYICSFDPPNVCTTWPVSYPTVGDHTFTYADQDGYAQQTCQNWGTFRADQDEWVRSEFYGQAGDTDVANGTVVWWNQLSENAPFSNILNCEGTAITRTSRYTYENPPRSLNVPWHETKLFTYIGLENTFRGDDIYIANSRARVEIGNDPNFANCTHREIQIPTSWSNGSITTNVNQGSFTNGQSAYLFVIDSSGVASPGYQIIINGGSSGDTTPPTNPTGLSVQ